MAASQPSEEPWRYGRVGSEKGTVMKSYSGFALMLGALVALGVIVFIASGGTLGGKTTVLGDRDLPPVATTGSN